MSHSWTKKLISGITAMSVVAALVVSVFSQAHAALSGDAQTNVSDPCAEHITTSAGTLAADNCETLCYSADLNHLLSAAIDRAQSLDLVAVAVSYQPVVRATFNGTAIPQVQYGRGPPGSDLYLITQRLRL